MNLISIFFPTMFMVVSLMGCADVPRRAAKPDRAAPEEIAKPSPKPESKAGKARQWPVLKADLKLDESVYRYGRNYYRSFCAFCHAFNGKGSLRVLPDIYMAPPLAGSKRLTGDPGNVVRILVNGLTGPVGGKSYLPIEMLPPKHAFTDKQLAAILTYARNSWGNKAPMITEDFVKKMKVQLKDRKKPWTEQELDALLRE